MSKTKICKRRGFFTIDLGLVYHSNRHNKSFSKSNLASWIIDVEKRVEYTLFDRVIFSDRQHGKYFCLVWGLYNLLRLYCMYVRLKYYILTYSTRIRFFHIFKCVLVTILVSPYTYYSLTTSFLCICIRL